MKIYLIRHGATRGNLEKRYVGSTDEAVLESERQKLENTGRMLRQDRADAGEDIKGAHREEFRVFVSPMKRCRETAELLFPGVRQTVVEAFRECDFGRFEYRNYRELDGDSDYQRFLDTCGESGFPGGETREEFCRRVELGFRQLMEEEPLFQVLNHTSEKQETERAIASMVVHGGTIMALMDTFGDSDKGYYDWQVKNGAGFLLDLTRDNRGAYHLRVVEEIG